VRELVRHDAQVHPAVRRAPFDRTARPPRREIFMTVQTDRNRPLHVMALQRKISGRLRARGDDPPPAVTDLFGSSDICMKTSDSDCRLTEIDCRLQDSRTRSETLQSLGARRRNGSKPRRSGRDDSSTVPHDVSMASCAMRRRLTKLTASAACQTRDPASPSLHEHRRSRRAR